MRFYNNMRLGLALRPLKAHLSQSAMMNALNRRKFLKKAAQQALVAGFLTSAVGSIRADDARKRRMTCDLVCGNLGFSASQTEAIDLASRHGFESVGVDGSYLASLEGSQLTDLKSAMRDKNLVFGAAGLPVEFRRDDVRFAESLAKLPPIVAGLQRAGVTRITTWLMPCDNHLTYMQNFRQHAERLRQVAKIAGDGGVRLGLEYVAPKTLWASQRYPFIHTMAEMKDLLAEIGAANVGMVLDSWHWWHAGDSAEDILTLRGGDVIAVDLNDAPAGIQKDQMSDNHRELPCATGVIDVGAFLSALNQIGYDGPVRAEPFNQAVNRMAKDEACAAAGSAVKKAFALIH
jgi:sugar phosphate isomerase/epimerase